MTYRQGPGEMLRYLSGHFDSSSEKMYPDLPVDYRSRYTPVLRAIAAGALTISDIKSMTLLTQGAVSQTVALMEKDGILERISLTDGRKQALLLTSAGRTVQCRLDVHWQALFLSIEILEQETGVSLMAALQKTIKALESRSAEERISEAKVELQKRKEKKS